MARLIVRVIGTDELTRKESILATIESDQYSPDHLDALVNAVLAKTLESLKQAHLDSLQCWCPEVSVELTAEEETIRPSLHLSQDTLQRLVAAGASFDFDPYV